MRAWRMAMAMAAGVAALARAEAGWVNVFDGATLNGWTQVNGSATCWVENGAIVGRTTEGSPNSFLCTAKEYGDFELEFEVRGDDGLNSGVQIRSKTKTVATGPGRNDQVGRVYGPQVEIACGDEKSSLSGFVYDEATGRGWLTAEERRVPHKNHRAGQWNRYRVVAKGPRIQTWINGKAVEDLVDEAMFSTHPAGFIGLQVHGVKPGTGPFEVRWRDLRVRELK